MKFEQLLKELQTISPGITESGLVKWLESKGMSAEDVQPGEITAIAAELSSNLPATTTGKLAKPAKAGKVDQRRSRTQKQPEKSAVAQTSQEMDAFEHAAIGAINQYVEKRSEAIVETIREAPNNLVKLVQEGLRESESDPDHFRTQGEQLAESLLGGI